MFTGYTSQIRTARALIDPHCFIFNFFASLPNYTSLGQKELTHLLLRYAYTCLTSGIWLLQHQIIRFSTTHALQDKIKDNQQDLSTIVPDLAMMASDLVRDLDPQVGFHPPPRSSCQKPHAPADVTPKCKPAHHNRNHVSCSKCA